MAVSISSRQAGSKARVFFNVLTAAFFTLVVAENALSQEVTAQVPITVNVDATVKIDPPSSNSNSIGDEGSVMANTQKVFNVKLVKGGTSQILHQPQKHVSNGAWLSHNHGNVTLNLHPQQYQNAAVSLHTLNGKRILSSKASAAKGTGSISRANVPAGVYLLSVKGTKGNSFATKLTHSGSILNINVAFGGAENHSLNKSAADEVNYGEWTITVSATGYGTQTRTFFPEEGLNAAQSFTLVSNSGESGKYSLSITRSPTTGGRVFVENVESTGTTFHDVEAQQIAVRAEAAIGYVFARWSGASTSTNASISVNMRANLTLTAIFEYVGTRTLTINRDPVEGGKVFVNNVEYAVATTHSTGAQVTVKAEAVANADYFFIRWSGASTSTNATVTLTMNNDMTLSAIFAKKSVVGSFTDSRDGKTYRTVIIMGGQRWMAQNLNFSAHQSGDSWCYDNEPSNCAKYGRLYTRDAAMEACPAGWHLPTSQEWTNLVETAGGNAGTKLRASSPDWDGTDEFGFSALPGGTRYDGRFDYAGSYGFWWCAAELWVSYAQYRYMFSNAPDVYENLNLDEGNGYSTLCVQD